jgi:serine/threonine kinase 32
MALDLAHGGDLRFNINKKVKFDDNTLRVYMAELGLAISYMHSQSTIHRDIKPENILVDRDGHLLLTDLNLATSLKKRKPTSQSGTLEYMGIIIIETAPEVILREPYGYSIDWWALGTILYELIYRTVQIVLTKLPFGGAEPHIIKENIKMKPLQFPNKDKRDKPIAENPERTDLIVKLLTRDVTKRLASSEDGNGFKNEFIYHPFLKDIDWKLVEEKKVMPVYKPNVNHLNLFRQMKTPSILLPTCLLKKCLVLAAFH